MGVGEIIALAVLGFILLLILTRVFARPLALIVKLLINTLLGFLGLGGINLLTPYIGLHIPLNFLSALTVGILGVPGILLLLVFQWIF